MTSGRCKLRKARDARQAHHRFLLRGRNAIVRLLRPRGASLKANGTAHLFEAETLIGKLQVVRR